jgi:hypothetical protein
MLENAGVGRNGGWDHPLTLLADKELLIPSRVSRARREGGKCKDRARGSLPTQINASCRPTFRNAASA